MCTSREVRHSCKELVYLLIRNRAAVDCHVVDVDDGDFGDGFAKACGTQRVKFQYEKKQKVWKESASFLQWSYESRISY